MHPKSAGSVIQLSALSALFFAEIRSLLASRREAGQLAG